MLIRVRGGSPLSGELRLPPSKLYTQFLSALAFLGEGKSVVRGPLAVKDTLPLLRELERLGATLSRGPGEWTIWGTGGEPRPKSSVLEAGNSGTVFGMLAGLATLCSGTMVVTGDAQLRQRPMPSLLRLLRALGAEVTPAGARQTPPFIVFGKGGVRGAEVGEVGPPELFTLLLLAPLAEGGVGAKVEGEGERMVEILRRAGAEVSGRVRVRISGGRLRPGVLRVPSSLHLAAPFVVASLLPGSKVVFRGGEVEGASFLRLLQEMGVEPAGGGGRWRFRGEPRGARVDLSGREELFPLAAVLACLAEGRTVFRGLSRARGMKSDRLSLTVENLRRMGARVKREGEGWVVEGGRLRGAKVRGGNDYAVVAALVVAGLAAEGETLVAEGPSALRSAYSGFLSEWRKLGAEVELVETP